MSMENHGGMISTRGTHDSSTRALCQAYQQSHRVADSKNKRRKDEFGLTKYLCSYFEGVFNMS
jgi:hypothetical protein